MRVSVTIAKERRDDAMLALDAIGFMREGSEDPCAREDAFVIVGDLLEKTAVFLPDVVGVLDWKTLPSEPSTAGDRPAWPWGQQPETD